jgi:hypothetical protein
MIRKDFMPKLLLLQGYFSKGAAASTPEAV